MTSTRTVTCSICNAASCAPLSVAPTRRRQPSVTSCGRSTGAEPLDARPRLRLRTQPSAAGRRAARGTPAAGARLGAVADSPTGLGPGPRGSGRPQHCLCVGALSVADPRAGAPERAGRRAGAGLRIAGVSALSPGDPGAAIRRGGPRLLKAGAREKLCPGGARGYGLSHEAERAGPENPGRHDPGSSAGRRVEWVCGRQCARRALPSWATRSAGRGWRRCA